MKEEELKSYLLIARIALIVIFSIGYLISSKTTSKELNKNGIKSTAFDKKNRNQKIPRILGVFF